MTRRPGHAARLAPASSEARGPAAGTHHLFCTKALSRMRAASTIRRWRPWPPRPEAKRSPPSAAGTLSVVHNGVTRDYSPSRNSSNPDGVVFRSTPIRRFIAHLIANRLARRATSRVDWTRGYHNDFQSGRCPNLILLKGTYGLAVGSPLFFPTWSSSVGGRVRLCWHRPGVNVRARILSRRSGSDRSRRSLFAGPSRCAPTGDSFSNPRRPTRRR